MKPPLIFHVRKICLYPELMDNVSSSTEYLRRQAMTFAFEERKDGWYAATSRTTYKDSFNRKIGRDIAIGRLHCKRKPHLATYFGKERPTYEDAATLYALDDVVRFEQHLDTGRCALAITDNRSFIINGYLETFARDSNPTTRVSTSHHGGSEYILR